MTWTCNIHAVGNELRCRVHASTSPPDRCRSPRGDITYLRSLVRGVFFYLYLVEDVWSRLIIGWAVHDAESAELAAALVERIRRESPGRDLRGWVLHSDNGNPMKGSTMLATLQRLGVVSSFSRVEWPEAQAFRQKLGLGPKKLHVTLNGGIGKAIEARNAEASAENAADEATENGEP
ncbi:MAG: DDE-type integrase/transposase/recombinase [Deltaproteobacteria bacterium]